jgi:O-antigen ligase
MSRIFNLEKVYQYLIITLAFLLPLTVAGANLIIFAILFLWFVSGNYGDKLNQIISSKIMVASIIFFGIHLVGLIWTENLDWGFHILRKMWYFLLLLPILYTLVKKEFVLYYKIAFITAILLIVVTSILIYFELISDDLIAIITTSKNPNPFMSHISYNPILAFSIYLVLYEILFIRTHTKTIIFLLIFCASLMTISMFITGGRAGQITFFLMIAIIIFQFFEYHKIKSLILILILMPVIFSVVYLTSSVFYDRVNMTVESIMNFEENKNTSLGERIIFNYNSLTLIKDHLIIGVGTGDFPIEYQKINMIKSPTMPNVDNPHNMYILILTQLGLTGLLSMLSIFYFQIKKTLTSFDKYYRDVGITLPLLFLTIMLSDSYLLGHFTSLMYVFFTAFLYKDFEKP